MLTLNHYLILAALLFAIGCIGLVLNRKNLLVVFMSLELLLIAVSMNFIALSHYLQDIQGQIFVFFILTIGAAEMALGLALMIVLFRQRRTISIQALESLKG